MNIAKLDKLFEDYEIAFDKLDFKTIAQNYPDAFLSAGPKGTVAQNKDEFVEKAAQASRFTKALGKKKPK